VLTKVVLIKYACQFAEKDMWLMQGTVNAKSGFIKVYLRQPDLVGLLQGPRGTKTRPVKVKSI
jgi:hypothetical protein